MNKINHIAIDARIINSSTGRYVERLIHFLEKIDTTNMYSIIVPSKDKDFYTPTNKNFRIVCGDFDNYSFAEQTKFKKFLDEMNPDLVHFCMPQQPVFYNGKKVTTFHDLTLLKTYNSDKNWLVFHIKQLIGRFIFKKVTEDNPAIIAISQFTKKELVEFSPIAENKISVIYESSDLVNTQEKPYETSFSKYLLYVGQQSDYKNIPRLAEAHQKLLKKYPDLGLVLVGNMNASTQKNKTLFSSKEYKNILFTGFVSDEELLYLYRNCSALVFPSLMEGFGLPGLEAMQAGAPVVSSSATCLPEVYGDAAHYFNPNDVDDIAQKINDVLSNENFSRSLQQKGFLKITEYSWEKMARETLAVYTKVLEN